MNKNIGVDDKITYAPIVGEEAVNLQVGPAPNYELR